jgi:hypothetical protein
MNTINLLIWDKIRSAVASYHGFTRYEYALALSP